MPKNLDHCSRRNFLKSGALLGTTVLSGLSFAEGSASELPNPHWQKLPKWRGFNLLEKFNVGSNKPFLEDDFRNIHDLGFNFVRLPMDYRCWIEKGNWRSFKEKTLQEIDQAVEYGEKYGIHVCMNFHRAPGWTVANPKEALSLWKDPEAQEVCALHWKTFAKRYRDIPNSRLSFNLLNEPASVEVDPYLEAMKIVIGAIRSESPDRLIICDGLQYGRVPVEQLKDLQIAQATRGYTPFELSHYRASWASGSDQFPYPQWPSATGNGKLFAPSKKGITEEAKKPITINGSFSKKAKLRIRVGTVSSRSQLCVYADDQEVFQHDFRPSEGKGEWSKAVFKSEWKCWQNIYDRDYFVDIPEGTTKIELRNLKGDWMSISEIGIQSEGSSEAIFRLVDQWNEPQNPYLWDEKNNSISGGKIKNRKWLMENFVQPWIDFEKSGAGGVIVGEFGSYNKTPHAVVLRWMEDMLQNWQTAGWGWAMWNFRGSIGVANSLREDVDYEDWRGLKLDRKMMDLLQRY
ncbi:MAG: cellulase family glycosylhydrolase [Planctomycetia bacterium]|nr:cellulase family glycosylhydrolase [Planctomycetia bacterium]